MFKRSLLTLLNLWLYSKNIFNIFSCFKQFEDSFTSHQWWAQLTKKLALLTYILLTK